jgi:hypothetical protein
VKQQTYHLRLTLTPPAPARMTPRVSQVGIEFRTPVDVSAECVIEPLTHAVEMPFGRAAIGEGRVSVVRTGRRDYRDVGADLAVDHSATKLEVDHFLGSRHPRVGRDRWFHIDRAPVSNRLPSGPAESFGLLSALKQLKRKIPERVETINKLHTVVAATTAQVQVTPNLQGATGTGSYNGLHYYMRVRTSAQVGVADGFLQEIDNNTNLDKLDFTATALPGTLIAGDVIEVHSAQFAQPVLQWIDTDPADIWWELFTVHLGVPPEKIGLGSAGSVGRSGLPPKITDRAPGDAPTQAKLKVTFKAKEAESADELIDQVSFLMGGVTVDIGGQFAYRQIYPVRDAVGAVVIAPAGSVHTFDPRDYSGLQTPTGVEARITSLACDYGVDLTSLSDEAQPTLTVNFVDADALAWLATQDVEGLGQGTIDKKIARWCYNSADAGKFLATQLAQQVVNATSTGKRLWPWHSVDAHPELAIGDVVTVVTDQYTDYDPTRKIKIRGWVAYALTLVSVSAGGRRFIGFMQGFGNAPQVKGGTGTLTPDVTTSNPPSARIEFVTRGPKTERIRFVFAAGGVGPLEWSYALDDAAFSAWFATGSPQLLTVIRKPYNPIAVRLQVRQGDGQIVISPPYSVAAIDEGQLGPSAKRMEEDSSRGGYGGVPTRRGRINPDPGYDDTGMTPLFDTVLKRVTPDLGASDGKGSIESKRAAREKASAAAGHAAQGITSEGRVRAGSGGMDTPRGRVNTEGFYDQTGFTPLIDPVTKEILAGLAIGADVRGHQTVRFGGTIKQPPARHTENFSGTHATSIVFGTSYDSVPEIRVLPAKFTLPGTSSTSNRLIEMLAQDPNVSGCTLRAVMSTGSSSAAQSENPSATLDGTTHATETINTQGGAAFWNLSNANATSTRYTVKYNVDTTGMTSGLLTVTLWKNLSTNGSATWIAVASAQYDIGGTWTDETLFFDGAMAANYDLKIVVTKTGGGPFAVVTAKACTYDKITAGSETNLAPAELVVQSLEKS